MAKYLEKHKGWINNEMWHDVGGAGGHDVLGPALKLHPGISTWRQWLKSSGFSLQDPQWILKLGKTPW